MQNRIVFRTGIILFLLMVIIPVFAQLSPGKLSESHAHLEGLSNCTQCHLLGEKASGEKCLDCHKEIASRIVDKRGYHSSAEVRGNTCIKCHSEHHGRNFQIIRFEAEEFDHSKSGYNLSGAHAKLSCRQCHKAEFIAEPKIKVKSKTYLGLEQNCLSCHENYHQGTLSSDCASCHNFKLFKPASGFSHNKTRHKLRGKHAALACEKCHKQIEINGVEIQQFAGVPFENCTSCHTDVHDNRFGQNCTQCHSEESFQKIKESAEFNHSLTRFPLEGQHQFVACAGCHKSAYTGTIKYNYCSDCHSDYHDKEFVHQGSSPDCSDCHTTLGFDRSEFTVERHNRTVFELKGAHLATPCFACHKKSNRWNFREIGTTCMDCHSNIHESYMDEKYYLEASCEGCHSSNRWNEIDFDHSNTDFTLEGAHLKQSCRACHFREADGEGEHQEFSDLSSNCINCHQDVHHGQFEEGSGTNCLKCHGYSDWSPGSFDHDQTAFKLVGKHKEVACSRCHTPVAKGDFRYTEYKLKEFSCESCH